MIGAAGTILLHTSAEFAENKRHYTLGVALFLQIALERRHRLRNLSEELSVSTRLRAVRIESAHRRVVDARRHAVANHRADRSKLPRERVIGIADEWLLRDCRKNAFACNLCIERGAHQEIFLRFSGRSGERARAIDRVVGILHRAVQIFAEPAEKRRILEGNRLLDIAFHRERRGASNCNRTLGNRRAVARCVEVATDPT